MCGIAGVIGYQRSHIDDALSRIRHRGPDCQQVWVSEKFSVLLGHVRLSIIDLDARSNQPFFSNCGRYIIVFNGEIYNYRQLRDRLSGSGTHFRTESDTEVLLCWLIEYGVEGLRDIEGMFAFGFLDSQTGELIVARDPIGEKPLYYTLSYFNGKVCFAFASEIKALLNLPGVDLSLEKEALRDYLRFLYTAPPHTFYKGIKELAPGGYLHLNVDRVEDYKIRNYYDLESRIKFDDATSFTSAVNSFGALFLTSVEKRLVSDVDVGIFLSAGLDSNAILEAASNFSERKRGKTYTLQYQDGYSERELAKRVAESKGLINEGIDFYKLNFHHSLSRMVDLFDQPFGNSTAIVSDMIAEVASKSCRVCLVGDGGDEVLVGYPRYKAVGFMAGLASVPKPFLSFSGALSSHLPERGKYAVPIRRFKQFLGKLTKSPGEAFLDWSSYLDTNQLSRAIGEREVETKFFNDLLGVFERHQSDPVRAATIVDMKSFVPFNLLQSADRTSMAHSLELRTPFLAPPLVEHCLGMHSAVRLVPGKTKPLLGTYFDGSIPKYILDQPKRPFNPPIRVMLYRDLPALEDLLLGSGARISGLLSKSFLVSEINDFKAKKRDNSTFLWGMATLETWLQRVR